MPTAVRQRLGSGAPRDLDELRPHLKAQADELIARATGELRARGDKEAAEMRAILEAQRLRIQKTAVEEGKGPRTSRALRSGRAQADRGRQAPLAEAAGRAGPRTRLRACPHPSEL